ncbi:MULTISPECIES: hypothetical protein [Gordonia]|uniref:Two-component histidine kinase n=1 Tax=Gordonia sputi NBRC 100414 TaxID=1089453 RepID=H5U6B3_9ACTN|nr:MULTISPECIES: hypothetical protein [Gordonia]NKY92200.1 hypothetical protein [Gordonia sputi]OBA73817.1 hypothetical protein A5777_00835 [Gordonia sp. 852002-10350_SCH5691597]GAB41271.1 hypothetical protein GOSPT_125_00380 [Gordonia sputi NBRC 100414]
MDTHELTDARHLLGMRERGVWLVVGTFVSACWLVALTSGDTVTSLWGPIAAAAIYSAATIGLVAAEGDPLPVTPTVLFAATGPVCSWLVLSVSSASAITSVAVAMSHGTSAAIYAFMVVRGRRVAPWLGFFATVVVFAVWGAMSGAGPILAVVQVTADAAPLLMAMLFSFTLNPTAREVFSLRQQTTVRVAQLAASRAAADERTRQVRQLASLARPLLELIASGAELTPAQRLDCEVLEAHLRDRLRAPLMSELDLDTPAYDARLRGVDVVLIDDSSEEIAQDVRERISRLATEVLRAAEDGEVFVRISPANRTSVASVLHRPVTGSSTRMEVDAEGGVRAAG